MSVTMMALLYCLPEDIADIALTSMSILEVVISNERCSTENALES